VPQHAAEEEVVRFGRILHLHGCIKTRGCVWVRILLGEVHEKHNVKRRFLVLIMDMNRVLREVRNDSI